VHRYHYASARAGYSSDLGEGSTEICVLEDAHCQHNIKTVIFKGESLSARRQSASTIIVADPSDASLNHRQ
jgi:hypothetical protein